MPALRQKSCSYKIESYWSYEVCHGGKIVQYHKEQENRGKKVIDQQYTLGRITPAQLQQLEADAKAEDAASSPTAREVSETKVEGTDVPYYPIRYADGSICELTGKPRVTDVLYVCYEHGRHDVYSVKETATCEYEIIVLTDVLCQHPLYTKKEKPEIPIHCVPTAAGARRPKELLRIEAHSLKLKTMPETKLSGSPESGAMALGKIDADLANVPATLLDENHDDQETDDDEDDDDDDESGDGFDKETSSSRNSKPFPPRPLTRDQSAVKSFLTGENCLDGGIGWWHYEFCYGRHVTQFHENKDGSRITILLGTFSAPKHIEWIKKHPKKAPNAYQVTHLYSDGAVCDVTGKPRVTEVRLKCYPPSQSLGVGTVAMYLIEPQPCHYILGVETGLVCDLLHDADEYGLLQHEIFDQTQVSSTYYLHISVHYFLCLIPVTGHLC
ncbi:hypothetical protein HAZT_HAZT008845 [Hyalella azteca]|uniref:Endoplasmic reticulum lectin 1 n=1 Tax=Hyalella azteca TaxID=294128 RepID=A0A6A0HG28_HYAAZ|nr:hypothetical protein HAZT_HAZT008845 [Hyalella azteca]